MNVFAVFRNALVLLPFLFGVHLGASDRIVITQKDEDEIHKLARAFNEDIGSIVYPNPEIHWYPGSSPPVDQLRETESFGQLMDFGLKLMPYLVRQRQIYAEGRVYLGSSLADREISCLEDLLEFNRDRASRLKKSASLWIRWPGSTALEEPLLEPDIAGQYGPCGAHSGRRRFPYVQWWDDHKNMFMFETAQPIIIDTTYKYDSRPHVSTQTAGGLLTLEAVSATYRQIIERAAVELEVDVFIGEQHYMRDLTRVRMRGVTFGEFAYLIGHSICESGFGYRKIGNAYHFGNDTKAGPRLFPGGWGIAMERTVFRAGEDVPVTIVPRREDRMTLADSDFFSYGRFRISDNTGNVIGDYRPRAAGGPGGPLLQKKKIDLIIDGGRGLKPGEYNLTFRYLENETSSIAFEVYPAGK